MAKRKLRGNAMSPKDEVAVRPDALESLLMQSLQPSGEQCTYDF